MTEGLPEQERGIEGPPQMPPSTERGSERWKTFYGWSELIMHSVALTGTFGVTALTAGYLVAPEVVQPVVDGLKERWLSIIVGYVGLLTFSNGVCTIDVLRSPQD